LQLFILGGLRPPCIWYRDKLRTSLASLFVKARCDRFLFYLIASLAWERLFVPSLRSGILPMVGLRPDIFIGLASLPAGLVFPNEVGVVFFGD